MCWPQPKNGQRGRNCTCDLNQKAAAPILVESNELVAISISSINTAKRNLEAED